MIYEFRLPDIGEGVVEGEVVRWLVKEGDPLRVDQPMVEIMTDKATVEIPAPRAGRVGKRMFAEGQLCPVGKVLITIEIDGGRRRGDKGAGAAADARRRRRRDARRAAAASAGRGAAPRGAAPLSPGGARARRSAPVLATPATRKLARDLGVDLRGVFGTGPPARITSDDVRDTSVGRRRRAPARAPAAAAGRAAHRAREPGDVRDPLPRPAQAASPRTWSRSKHTAAHFLYVEEVDCTELVALREQANARLQADARRASSRSCRSSSRRRRPRCASSRSSTPRSTRRRARSCSARTSTSASRRRPRPGSSCPSCATPTGARVAELAQEIDRLAEATRTGKATREDLSGSTFTITSPGQLGGVLATPIINSPRGRDPRRAQDRQAARRARRHHRHPRPHEPLDLRRPPRRRRARRRALRGRHQGRPRGAGPAVLESV